MDHPRHARMAGIHRLFGCIALASLALAFPAWAADRSPSAPTTRETPLGRLPEHVTPHQISISSDGSRWAYVDRNRRSVFAVVDGKPHDPVEWIADSTVHLSPDGAHAIYKVRDRKGAFLVLDAVPGRVYADVREWAFSPQGGHLAYTARLPDGKRVAVVDEVESGPYADVRVEAVGDDGRAFLIITEVDGDRLVFGNQKHPVYDWVFDVRLDSDGRRLAYRAGKNRTWRMVIDGQEGPAFDQLKAPHFSPDGKRIGYVGQRAGKWRFIIDSAATEPFDHTDMPGPIFSPDSQHVVVVAKRGARYVLLVDGQEKASADWIAPNPIYSPDSRRLAWIARDGLEGTRIVVDGKPGQLWDDLSSLRFSPDSRRIAYLATGPRGMSAVVDGVASRPHPLIAPFSLTFSPDSRHYAYIAETTQPATDMQGRPARMPATQEKTTASLVVNELPPIDYRAILGSHPLHWDGPATLRFFAVRDNQLLAVQATLDLE